MAATDDEAREPGTAPGLDDVGTGEPERSPLVLVGQFFLIPLAVVVLAVSVFLLFGFLTREKRSAAEYLAEVRRASMNRRWQAAYEFSLQFAREPDLIRDQGLFEETLRTFKEVRDEPRVRRYLALALGRFQKREAVKPLIEALGDGDEETRLYAALALASIGDREATAPLVALLGAEEPALRRAAAYALGVLGDPEARERLKVAADDRRLDVGLQAALSLAQLGDGYGLPVLRRALDPAALSGAVAMEPSQLTEARVNAIRGIVLLGDRGSVERLRVLSREDPELKVRDAALRALEDLRGEGGPAP